MWPFPQKSSTGPLTFKQRVAEFWEWFPARASHFHQAIRSGTLEAHAEVVSAAVDKLGDFAWTFGPGERGGHSFTLTGEGNLHRQLLAAYWKRQAPEIAGWDFHAARPPATELMPLHLGGHDFDPKGFWLKPTLDLERERINLTVWHPLFEGLEENTQWTVLFLMLDEALGEVGTHNFVGEIQIHPHNLSEALMLSELLPFTRKVQAEHHWHSAEPGEIWTGYELRENHCARRGDVFIGSTRNMALIDAFLEANGELANPLEGYGADYLYVEFPATVLEPGKEVEGRSRVEDALEAALGSVASGVTLGGAMGQHSTYVDLLLFDDVQSQAVVMAELQKLALPAGTSLNYFDHARREQRQVL